MNKNNYHVEFISSPEIEPEDAVKFWTRRALSLYPLYSINTLFGLSTDDFMISLLFEKIQNCKS